MPLTVKSHETTQHTYHRTITQIFWKSTKPVGSPLQLPCSWTPLFATWRDAAFAIAIEGVTVRMLLRQLIRSPFPVLNFDFHMGSSGGYGWVLSNSRLRAAEAVLCFEQRISCTFQALTSRTALLPIGTSENLKIEHKFKKLELCPICQLWITCTVRQPKTFCILRYLLEYTSDTFIWLYFFFKTEKSLYVVLSFHPDAKLVFRPLKTAALGKLLRARKALSCLHAWRKRASLGLSCLPCVVFCVRHMFAHLEVTKGRCAIVRRR